MHDIVLGIHHVTAIAGDPQRNVDFYTGVLGLRVVKVTINYDDPATYHLYYGDTLGRPGTILTFFAWPKGFAGRNGTGQVISTALAIPDSAAAYWIDRLESMGVSPGVSAGRFDEAEIIAFEDPDGLPLELVTVPDSTVPTSDSVYRSPVPDAFSISGIHSVTLSVEGYERTARLLTETLGFTAGPESAGRFRYRLPGDGPGQTVDIVCRPGTVRGQVGAGAVHHVAWRTPDDPAQARWHRQLVESGYDVSPVMDRQYFHSIYFREPGGVLFEIATDPPGFTADEAPEMLGSRLRLPDWLEPQRERIERMLPPLTVPGPSDADRD